MIKKLNFLGTPTRDKLNLFVSAGTLLFVLGIIDVILNSFFETNITSFLPRWINYFTPLVFSFVGLHCIRIEFSGIGQLDRLNKNINSNWFNAILTSLIIFVLIKNIPPLLNWLFFDADFIGTSKEECSREGACWIFIKVWFDRLIYGLYPNSEIWRINLSFLMLIGLVISAFFVAPKIKKYIIIFLLFIFPFIAINLISGGNFGLEWVETPAWGGLSLTFIISIFALLFCILNIYTTPTPQSNIVRMD